MFLQDIIGKRESLLMFVWNCIFGFICSLLEESVNFVTVDEVGEEEAEEEEKEAVTTRTKAQAKKRTRQTPGNTQDTQKWQM